MDEGMKKPIMKSEAQFHRWFVNNYEKIGYDKIIRKDIGKFPDFIMLKDGKKKRVGLETLASNFILHKHDVNKADELICIKNDLSNNALNISIIELKELEFSPKIRRISATVDGDTVKDIDKILKKGRFRNKSHVIEEAIKLLLRKLK